MIGADERRNAYQRTLREARTAARLSHRGVVAVYDVAEEDGRPWIVMELVPSQSLDQVLVVEGRLPAAAPAGSASSCCPRSPPRTRPGCCTGT